MFVLSITPQRTLVTSQIMSLSCEYFIFHVHGMQRGICLAISGVFLSRRHGVWGRGGGLGSAY